MAEATTDITDADVKTDRPLSTENNINTCTPNDLIELVRAIKFAHTDMSIRNVHNEISVTMAEADPSYAFLKQVKFTDVKKVWKKALKGSPDNSKNSGITHSQQKDSEHGIEKEKNVSDDIQPPPIVPSKGVIKFYTVGDGSVKALAENYANHYAEEAVAANKQQKEEIEKEKGKYTHFFLDVPADLSGSRPHQALINYQENHKSGKGKKKKSTASYPNNEGKEIFKIQLAALPPGMEDVPTPMLLYNSDRTSKTFLHPPSSTDDKDNDDGGYAKIRQMISDSGINGALGATGGQKAYFYGFITKTKSGPNVVSIDLHSGLVPSQTW